MTLAFIVNIYLRESKSSYLRKSKIRSLYCNIPAPILEEIQNTSLCAQRLLWEIKYSTVLLSTWIAIQALLQRKGREASIKGFELLRRKCQWTAPSSVCWWSCLPRGSFLVTRCTHWQRQGRKTSTRPTMGFRSKNCGNLLVSNSPGIWEELFLPWWRRTLTCRCPWKFMFLWRDYLMERHVRVSCYLTKYFRLFMPMVQHGRNAFYLTAPSYQIFGPASVNILALKIILWRHSLISQPMSYLWVCMGTRCPC